MNFFPPISYRFIRIWQRNLTVHKKTWKITGIPPLLEPLFYLAAFGMGLSVMAGPIHYHGTAVTYTAFIAPGLVAINVMQSAFFENTYGSFVRMTYQKTFDAILATPLTLPEVVLGEIFWGATKAAYSSVLMMAVLIPFGLLNLSDVLLILPIAFIGGFAFACAGMVCTAITPSIEIFNLPIFLFITPMFLFSGTFFPLENLPTWAQAVANALPLTHLVNLIRSVALGRLSAADIVPMLYLVAMSVILLPLALVGIRRRLIR